MSKNWYAYNHQRGFSIGCQPKGFVDHDEKILKYGGVAYDRELTTKEMHEYELVHICPVCKENELSPLLGENAFSRKDNHTEICSECGVAEAMEELEKMLEEF